MKIAVMVKQVPDTDEVKMDPETGTMVRDGVDGIINPLDLNALQAALDIKNSHETEDVSVTVFSMGPPQAEEALREAVSLGCDEAYLLSDRGFAGSDTWSTARVLSTFLKLKGGYDIILAGEKATDGETGQVGPEVASMLGIPFSTYVSYVERSEDSVIVERTVEAGFQRQKLPFPCLLTVLRDLNDPVMPTLSGKKRGRRINIECLDLKDLEMKDEDTGLKGSPTRVVRIERPKVSRDTRFFSGSSIDEGIEEILNLLKQKALI